jgi:hypothetical protein
VLQRLLGSTTGMEGEAWDIFSQLPKDLKRLWLEAAVSSGAMLATAHADHMHARRA